MIFLRSLLITALVVILLLFLISCGGGGDNNDQNNQPTPEPASSAGTWVEYDGAYFGHKRIRWDVIVNPLTGFVVPPLPQFTSYDVEVASSPIAKVNDFCGMANWSGSLEFHRVPVASFHGERWHWIDGYGAQNTGAFYPVETIRADWVDLLTGITTDITPPGPAPQGQPYHPFNIPPTGRKLIRVWGWIWDSMTTGRSRQFYWQSEFDYGLTSNNPAWRVDSQNTRQIIKQFEGWWDSGSESWVRATGTMPFDAGGSPIVPTVSYLGFDILGRGAGAGWSYEYEGWRVGVATIDSLP